MLKILLNKGSVKNIRIQLKKKKNNRIFHFSMVNITADVYLFTKTLMVSSAAVAMTIAIVDEAKKK